jgi:Tetratricopeptide repeat
MTRGKDDPETLTSMYVLGSVYIPESGAMDGGGKIERASVRGKKLKTALGPECSDTLISTGSLASTFWKQGQWTEAEKLEVQVLEMRKTVLGPEHRPDTLISMWHLAGKIGAEIVMSWLCWKPAFNFKINN